MKENRFTTRCGLAASVLVAWPVCALIYYDHCGSGNFDGLEYIVITPLAWMVAFVLCIIGLCSIPSAAESKSSRSVRLFAASTCAVPLLVMVGLLAWVCSVRARMPKKMSDEDLVKWAQEEFEQPDGEATSKPAPSAVSEASHP